MTGQQLTIFGDAVVEEIDIDEFDFAALESVYHDETIVRWLYVDCGLTESEIANKYDVEQSTVSDWLSGVETVNRSGEHGSLYFDRPSGGRVEYPKFMAWDAEGIDQVRLHQLQACVDIDPHIVFDSDTVIHHECESLVAINLSSNLSVATRSGHNTVHKHGVGEQSIEEVVAQEE